MLKQYFSSNVNRMVRPSRMRKIARGLGLALFIEGFALYGASLHPSATFLAEAALATAELLYPARLLWPDVTAQRV